MRIAKFLHLFAAMLLCGYLSAQDIHFSQFNMSPLTLNPAYTGAFEGTFRIGGIYRNQWASIVNNAYSTPSLYVDAPLFRGFGKNDWVGGGVLFLNDQAGTAKLSNLTAGASLAYHLGIGKKANTYLTLGLQGGYVQKKLDNTQLIFGDSYSGNGQFNNQTTENLGDLSKVSYTDFGAGLLFNTYFSSKTNFYAGFSASHLLEPEDAFLTTTGGDDRKLPRRYQGHGGLNVDLGTRWVLSPSVLYQRQSSASELNAQALLGYHLNSSRDLTLRFGGGYRLDDAAIAMLGLDYKGLKVGVAYDVNTSALNNATNGRGGYEIAASYIAKIYRTPVVKPVIFCPRF